MKFDNKLIEEINDIDTRTELGMLLLMAIAVITTTSETDKTPDEVIQQLNDKKCEVWPENVDN